MSRYMVDRETVQHLPSWKKERETVSQGTQTIATYITEEWKQSR